MSGITIYVGNKNYSSWSLRAWLALRRTGAPFQEQVMDISYAAPREPIRRINPAGRVPALRDGGLLVWDSLAICEHLAERFPEAHLWPEGRDARAIARSACAEMHSGFQALRQNMPMNIRRRSPGKGRAEGVAEDIARITELWGDCRERFGSGGDFLFGRFSNADAFYAPVVTRFRTYAVDLDATCRRYSDAVLALPEMAEWCAAAEAEAATIERYEL